MIDKVNETLKSRGLKFVSDDSEEHDGFDVYVLHEYDQLARWVQTQGGS